MLKRLWRRPGAVLVTAPAPYRLALSLALGCLLLAPAPYAFGRATEHFGISPVPAGWQLDPGLRPLLNDARRAYWYEVNGDARFFFQGDTAAANEALRRFAAGGKGREVVLHPGPLKVSSFDKTRHFTIDWEIHVPGGLTLSDRADGGLVTDSGPALHLYVGRARPAVPAAPAELGRWVKELGSERFKRRERAERVLQGQGQAAEGALRKALADNPPLETRRRVAALLARLPGINLDLLVVPSELRAVGPGELLARCRKGLHSRDPVVRGVAAYLVAEREPDPKVALATLVGLLKGDKDSYVRRSAAGALGRMGKGAEPALPLLRQGLHDPDANVRNAFRAAVSKIERAKEEPERAEWSRRVRVIQQDIETFLRSLSEAGRK